jgi:hypothetical protein
MARGSGWLGYLLTLSHASLHPYFLRLETATRFLYRVQKKRRMQPERYVPYTSNLLKDKQH